MNSFQATRDPNAHNEQPSSVPRGSTRANNPAAFVSTKFPRNHFVHPPPPYYGPRGAHSQYRMPAQFPTNGPPQQPRLPDSRAMYRPGPAWPASRNVFRGRADVFRGEPSFPHQPLTTGPPIMRSSSHMSPLESRQEEDPTVYSHYGAPSYDLVIPHSMSCPSPRQPSYRDMSRRTPSFSESYNERSSPTFNSQGEQLDSESIDFERDREECEAVFHCGTANEKGAVTSEERSPVPVPRRSPAPSGSLTPRTTEPRMFSTRDKEGKKLVLTVSASPTQDGRSHQSAPRVQRTNSAVLPVQDSPGPAFLSIIQDLNEQEELAFDESYFGRGLSNSDSFNLLPLLDGEADQQRTSPPMIPFLSKSPVLSWEIAEGSADEEKAGETLNVSNQMGKGQRKESTIADTENSCQEMNLSMGKNTESFLVDTASVAFSRRNLPQEERQDRNIMQSNEKNKEIGNTARNMETSSETARGSVGSREDQRKIMPPSQPYHSRGNFAGMCGIPGNVSNAQIQAKTHPFRFSANSGIRGSVAMCPPLLQQHQQRIASMSSFPPHQSLSDLIGESKGRCVALEPLPCKFLGDIEKCKDEKIPDFSTLVNFPNNATLRQNRLLPCGIRCCVMCGCIRPTCSRSRSRRGNDSTSSQPPQSPGGCDLLINRAASSDCDDLTVTIPTQNKGLCTVCDISVWVVTETGRQIKWCKGCKNFRPWAAFGDKGLATKCTRCRERQREKYALLKDPKKRKGKDDR